jgi:hypothetical protein
MERRLVTVARAIGSALALSACSGGPPGGGSNSENDCIFHTFQVVRSECLLLPGFFLNAPLSTVYRVNSIPSYGASVDGIVFLMIDAPEETPAGKIRILLKDGESDRVLKTMEGSLPELEALSELKVIGRHLYQVGPNGDPTTEYHFSPRKRYRVAVDYTPSDTATKAEAYVAIRFY